MHQVFAAVAWGLLIAYPAIVYFGLQKLPLPYLGVFLMLIALLRLLFFRRQSETGQIPILLTGLLMLAGAHALLSGSSTGLYYYPVAVNAVLLLVFASSLFAGQPVIERIARLQEPNLPAKAIAYTRKVTIAWCVFFLFNGAIALYTVLNTDPATWALYNGLISYVLMGTLFGIEYLIRRRVRRSDDDHSF